MMAATIKQVAQRAGVSTATVSYVLNGTGTVTQPTRERVLAAVAELDYQPSHAARSLRGRSHTIGVALPAHPGHLADPAVAEVLAALTDTAALRGYTVLLAVADQQRTPADHSLALIRSGQVDGLVLLELLAEDERAQALATAGLPHVCFGPVSPDQASPAVAVDVFAGAYQAVQFLVQLGHASIALLQLPAELVGSEQQFLGYAAALEAHGLAVDPALVVEAGRSQQDGYLALQELLGNTDRPTAVLACSDELALGALRAAHEAGLSIGADISIVGFDDTLLAAYSNPPLTTVHQPRHRIGSQLAAALIDTIEQRQRAAGGLTLAPRLVIRQSTGRPAR